MDPSPPELEVVPVSEDGGPWRRRLRIAGPFGAVAALVLVVALAIGGSTGPPAAGNPASATGSTSSIGPVGPPAGSGALVAVVDVSGTMTTTDGSGGTAVAYGVPGVTFGFPAWSPDGTRLAAVGSGPDDTVIYVFDVHRAVSPAGPVGSSDGPSDGPGPVVIYRSATDPPFYLFWTPDGRSIAFLANDPTGLALRLAPADGSAPIDGSGPGAVIRRGAPLYFDWEGSDRLLVHVGIGERAFLGEVGLDGASIGPAITGGGDFRSASASEDGRYLAYVQGVGRSAEIVVSARDGSSEHRLPVAGPAAVVFDPTGDRVATNAAATAVPGAPTFPFGPLRLLDPVSGVGRTLLAGSVVAFFWSPDGRTIAALRVSGPGGQIAGREPSMKLAATRAVRPSPDVIPTAAASASPAPIVELVFVDVASGAVRSERQVSLGYHFIGELLPYFDQYALSHRLWAPDSSSLLLPLVDANGRTRLTSVPPDGSATRAIADGISGFWSP